MKIAALRGATETQFAQLVALLRDAVLSGASVGYVLPVTDDELADFWDGALADVAHGNRLLLVLEVEDAIVGSAQLELAMKPNARHRAEVQKVLVHSAHRRAGYGRLLMEAVETAARQLDRSLLVLDTESGCAGQKLYDRMGFTVAGIIPDFAIGTVSGMCATTYMYKRLGTTA